MENEERIVVPNADEPQGLNRRDFVRILTTAAIGAGTMAAAFKGFVLTPSQRAEAAEVIADKVGKMPKTTLGKRIKGPKIAPMMICQDWPKELYAPALAAGLNYVHKAGYWRNLPEEFAKIPRESFVTDITVDSTPNNPDDEDAAYRQVTEALDRTGLKYFDIFKAHFGWKTVAEMKEKRGTYKAFQRLKKEGKVKYFGVSQHDYIPYSEITAAQIEEGLIDTMQVFFAYGKPKDVVEIFEKAHKAGVGMVAMKGMAHGSDPMRANPAYMAKLKCEGKVGRACYRHILTLKGSDGKPIFDACVTNLRNFDQFEENIGAATMKVAAADGFILDV